jgi:heme ABC exporter ATP-binding subunit CcmA
MASFLSCRHVSRFFGDRAVLREVSFESGAGRTVALWGPNGAGKSTLLRILAGALRPSAGEAWIGGVPAGSPAARRQTGFLSHQSLLHPYLTVRENLRFYATLFELPAPEQAVRVALEQVRGESLAQLRAGELSQGMRQKAALARSLLHRPKLLLLDEPFASLDRATVAELRRSLAELRASGMAILATSHQEEALRDLADQELWLDRGRLAPLPEVRA